jgi:hypothetical protein
VSATAQPSPRASIGPPVLIAAVPRTMRLGPRSSRRCGDGDIGTLAGGYAVAGNSPCGRVTVSPLAGSSTTSPAAQRPRAGCLGEPVRAPRHQYRTDAISAGRVMGGDPSGARSPRRNTTSVVASTASDSPIWPTTEASGRGVPDKLAESSRPAAASAWQQSAQPEPERP